MTMAMVRQCDGDGAMTRWLDSTLAMKWRSIAILVFRIIALSVSRHRTIDLFAYALFLRKWRQMWIFIKHTNVNKRILDHSFISATLIFLAYCFKIIKKISNAFFLSRYKPGKNRVMNGVTHTRKMERVNVICVHYRMSPLPWFRSSYLTYWLKCIIKSDKS